MPANRLFCIDHSRLMSGGYFRERAKKPEPQQKGLNIVRETKKKKENKSKKHGGTRSPSELQVSHIENENTSYVLVPVSIQSMFNFEAFFLMLPTEKRLDAKPKNKHHAHWLRTKCQTKT